MASFFDDEAEVGTTDDEDEMETEGTLKVRNFLSIKSIWLLWYDQNYVVPKSIRRLQILTSAFTVSCKDVFKTCIGR